jgi:hypothetical protein
MRNRRRDVRRYGYAQFQLCGRNILRNRRNPLRNRRGIRGGSMSEMAERYVGTLMEYCKDLFRFGRGLEAFRPLADELLKYMNESHAQRTQLTLAQEMARENERLKQRVKELEELQLLDVHAICDQRDSYRAECDKLREENKKLREDKERLDWLERKSDGSSWIVEDDGYRFALVLTRRDMSYHPDARSTARKAIAAMQNEKEKQ